MHTVCMGLFRACAPAATRPSQPAGEACGVVEGRWGNKPAAGGAAAVGGEEGEPCAAEPLLCAAGEAACWQRPLLLLCFTVAPPQRQHTPAIIIPAHQPTSEPGPDDSCRRCLPRRDADADANACGGAGGGGGARGPRHSRRISSCQGTAAPRLSPDHAPSDAFAPLHHERGSLSCHSAIVRARGSGAGSWQGGRAGRGAAVMSLRGGGRGGVVATAARGGGRAARPPQARLVPDFKPAGEAELAEPAPKIETVRGGWGKGGVG